MDRAGSRRTVLRIIRSAGFAVRNHHEGPCILLRAVFCCKSAGLAAHGQLYMMVADLCWNSSLCEVLGVNGVSSWIILADTRDRKLSGFPADLGSCDGGRNRETGVRKPLMDLCHDCFPDLLVVGSTASDG